MKPIKNEFLPHCNSRPKGGVIDTIVIHSMYAKGGKNPFSLKSCIKVLDLYQVASHYIIDRKGKIVRLVPDSKRAWHAGASKMPFRKDQRENVNDFSIGIELIGTTWASFTESQYKALAELFVDLLAKYPIKNIVAHSEIAPDRKKDPGRRFSWQKFLRAIRVRGVDTKTLRIA